MPRLPRIGIVGAGAGGLSLAKLLTERGFADVTVIERLDRVGGKSLTVHHEGLGHELGTCYVADGYRTTKRWMKQVGVDLHQLAVHHIYDRSGALVPFVDFVKGDGRLATLALGKQVLRYVRLRWSTPAGGFVTPTPARTPRMPGVGRRPTPVGCSSRGAPPTSRRLPVPAQRRAPTFTFATGTAARRAAIASCSTHCSPTSRPTAGSRSPLAGACGSATSNELRSTHGPDYQSDPRFAL